MPVLPLHVGTILASEDAVAKDLLAAHHDEFAAALDRLEGRTEFQVKGRYVEDAILGEVLSHDKQGAELQEAIQGQDPDAARDARTELGQFLSRAAKAWPMNGKDGSTFSCWGPWPHTTSPGRRNRKADGQDSCTAQR